MKDLRDKVMWLEGQMATYVDMLKLIYETPTIVKQLKEQREGHV